MGLADHLTTPNPRPHGLPCSIAQLLNTLPNQDREALETMLADPAWTEPMIWQALLDEGYTVGKQTIGRHRRGDCRCAVERR